MHDGDDQNLVLPRLVDEPVGETPRQATTGTWRNCLPGFGKVEDSPDRGQRLDAEGSLRGADTKFRRRFTQVEKLVTERGLSLPDLKFAQLDELWVEAKRVVG